MLAAGCVGILGAVLEWVTITPPPGPQAPVDFGTDVSISKTTRPFNGLEVQGGWFGIPDGWWVVIGSVGLIACSFLLVARRRASFGWLAFASSMLIGIIGIADYRQLSGPDDVASSIGQRIDIVGQAEPALGLLLVAAAGFAGIIASVTGIVATPANSLPETSA